MYTVGLDVDTHSIMNNLALGVLGMITPSLREPYKKNYNNSLLQSRCLTSSPELWLAQPSYYFSPFPGINITPTLLPLTVSKAASPGSLIIIGEGRGPLLRLPTARASFSPLESTVGTRREINKGGLLNDYTSSSCIIKFGLTIPYGGDTKKGGGREGLLEDFYPTPHPRCLQRGGLGMVEIEQISDHMKKHEKPLAEAEFGYYLAGLIEGSGYFGDQ